MLNETMLAEGINDSQASVAAIAEFLAKIKPNIAYVSIPTRPPAEGDVHAPSEEVINRAYQMLQAKLPAVEYLVGYEGDAFTGNAERDLLSITAVHPMREEAVRELLVKAGTDWKLVQRLLVEGKLKQVKFSGARFYVRCLHH